MIINTGVNSTTAEVNGILTQLENEVNTLVTELNTNMTNMVTELSNEVSTLLTILNTTVSNSVGAVKSVQRGVQASKNTVSTITINPVNPDKCLVLLDSGYIGNGGTFNLPSLVSLTSTELTVSSVGINNSVGVSGGNFSWQVIEFY
jgi:hypothetical protein